MMQAIPRAALKVVEAELFFHLLVRLLAGPPALEGSDQNLERGVRRVVRQVVLGLAAGTALENQPALVAGAVAVVDDRFAIGDANTQSCELGAEHAFGAATPGDRPEGMWSERLEHIACAARFGRRRAPCAGSTRRRR